jgi:hypothetical protein
MAKSTKPDKKKPGKLHVEIPKANWARLEAVIKAYNEDPARLTPKIKPAHVINEALVHFLSGRGV